MGKTGDFLCIKWLLLMMNRSSWRDCRGFCHGKNITAGLQPQPATEKPDILFSDICMPGLDGLSMIAALKVEFPDMEISILTGFRESHIFPECLRRTRGFLRTSTEIQRLPENYQKSKNCMKSNGVRLTSF